MTNGGRVAIVTGAAGGLGRALAAALAAAGYRLALMDLRPEPLQALSDAIWHERGEGSVLPLAGDVGDPVVCDEAVGRALETFGAVDVLVNNAGIGMNAIRAEHHHRPIGAFDEVAVADWERFLRVNATAAYLMTRAVLPHMRAAGRGRIVNVTTSLSTMLKRGYFPYGATKAALEAASAQWAAELAEGGVTVNVLVPGGPTDTDMVTPESFPDRSRLLRPEVMAPPLLWLASPDSDGFTGRRIVAALWDGALAPREAAEAAGAPIGWPDLGPPALWPDAGA